MTKFLLIQRNTKGMTFLIQWLKPRTQIKETTDKGEKETTSQGGVIEAEVEETTEVKGITIEITEVRGTTGEIRTTEKRKERGTISPKGRMKKMIENLDD